MVEPDVGSVVVGTDGSESSLGAVAWAATEAVARGRPLRVVHGFIWPLIRHPVAGGTARAGLREAAEKVLAEAVERARAEAPDVAVTGEVVTGGAADILVDESARADLVVVGSRGLGGFSGLLVGSVAVAVTARGHSPVVVVRGSPGADRDPARSVVVGVDGEQSEPAVDFAFDAASRYSTGLVAVRAWGGGVVDALALAAQVDVIGPDWPGVEEEIRRELSETVAGRRERYPDVTVHERVVRERASAAVVAASRQARLLVVGSRGGGQLSGLLLGSVSHAAIHHSDCPVAVVRPTTRR